MVLRYACLSSEKLQGAAENIVAKSLHNNIEVINQRGGKSNNASQPNVL